MKSSRQFHGKNEAFTLIELMVSMSILCMILAFFTQAVGSVNGIWNTSRDKMNNYARARIVLDTLQMDLDRAVMRGDIAAFVDAAGNAQDADGNGFLNFYAERKSESGTTDERRLSLISYRVDPNDKTSLLRRVLPVNWDETSRVNFGNSTELAELENTETVENEMVPGISSFSVKFLDDAGKETDGYEPGTSEAILLSFSVLDDNPRATQEDARIFERIFPLPKPVEQ